METQNKCFPKFCRECPLKCIIERDYLHLKGGKKLFGCFDKGDDEFFKKHFPHLNMYYIVELENMFVFDEEKRKFVNLFASAYIPAWLKNQVKTFISHKTVKGMENDTMKVTEKEFQTLVSESGECKYYVEQTVRMLSK